MSKKIIPVSEYIQKSNEYIKLINRLYILSDILVDTQENMSDMYISKLKKQPTFDKLNQEVQDAHIKLRAMV